MDAIVVENLTKTYRGGVQALAGVSFTVRSGEIFGLLGPNGAGKSTTVRILATLTRADGGRAAVAGYDVAREPGRVRRSIGYVAQASGVDKYGTGRENLTLQAHIQRVPRQEIRRRVAETLELVGLTEAADRLVNGYSGGMRRRLDIAMGLIHRPAVLFLDEPTTGLDPETRAALWEDLQRLRRERNMAVLLTTHYLEEADRLCDRLAIVDRGRVVAEGTPAALKAQIHGDSVTLEVDRPPEEAAGLLRGLEGVLDVRPLEGALVAHVETGATALPALITTLERAGVGVRSAALHRPSLDDVYLHHTGRRFAAEGDARAPETEAARGRKERAR